MDDDFCCEEARCACVNLTLDTTDDIISQYQLTPREPPSRRKRVVEVIGKEGALKALLSRGSKDALYTARPTRPEWQSLALPPDATDERPHCLPRMMQSYVSACLQGTLNLTTDASFYDGMMAQQAIHAVEFCRPPPQRAPYRIEFSTADAGAMPGHEIHLQSHPSTFGLAD